jgi:8-oxo-dGTP pyrophosphatase MutT (NUDIX family)
VTKITDDIVRSNLAQHEPVRAAVTGRMQAAVAVLLAPDESGDLALLLIRRADVEGDPWSGQMGLPGGRREEGDRDLLATARRETEEEIAVPLAEKSLVGSLDDIAPVTPVLPPVIVRPFVFALDLLPDITPSREVALHLWTSLDQLATTAAETEIRIRGESRFMPAFLIGPHVVWGMTHCILSNLIDIVRL